MENDERQYTFDRVVRMVLGAVTLIAVLALLRYLSDVLLPFAAALVFAYLLNPLVTFFEQKTKRRRLAVAMTLGGFGIVGVVLVAIVVPLMIGQVREFGDTLEELRGDLVSSMESGVDEAHPPSNASDEPEAEQIATGKSATGLRELTNAWGRFRQDPDSRLRPERLNQLFDEVSGTYVGDLLDGARRYARSDEFQQLLVDGVRRLAVGGWTVITFTVNLVLGLTGLIVVLLYLVFLLLDFPEYARTWKTFLPPQYRSAIVEFLEQFNIAMRRYFRGQSVVALSVGVLFAIGFTIIGLPMAVPLGLFVGLLNMVPYLQTVGLVPAVLLAGFRSIEGDSSFLVSVVLTVLVFAVVQMIQDILITPRVMGKATGLRPVAILLGVFIWSKLLGFLGLLLAIPLTCLGIAYYRRYVLLHAPETTKLSHES